MAFVNRTLYIAPTVRQSRSTCTSPCTCRCHRISRWASPYHLSSLLGRLFTGYIGLPITTPTCNRNECQRVYQPSVSLRYYFPQWLAQYTLQLHLHLPRHGGIEQSLRVSHVVWDGAEVFHMAEFGDVEGIKALLATREYSPFDVTATWNQTTLMVSPLSSTSDLDITVTK